MSVPTLDRDLPGRDAHDGGVPVDLLPDDQALRDTQASAVVGKPLAPGQPSREAHRSGAGGDSLPPTENDAKSRAATLAASPSDPGQAARDTHHTVAGADLDGDQAQADAQPAGVAVNPLAEFALGMAAASLSDIERTRISLGLRLGAMEREGIDGTPEHATLKVIHEGMVAIEHQATLNLQRALRKHPLGPWVKRTIGVGEKQGARLIAAIGDPYWNALDDRPRRGPAELWAYCGYAPEQKRRKGVKSNWNAEAKMRAFLIAESCIKQMHSPYRADYDRARANWADRDTSDGHKHNHALRVVAKEILKDLFLAARAAA